MESQLQPFSFSDCVFKIKEIYENSNNILDNMVKINVIEQHLRRYLADEDSADVFEGFVRLVNFLDKITTTVAKQYDLSLVKTALYAYYDYVRERSNNGEAVAALQHELDDDTLIPKALEVFTDFKFKHAPAIVAVFQLQTPQMTPHAKNIILKLLTTRDFTKAVQWMALLNLRDHFPFEKTISQLIDENQIGILDMFIGEAEYRRKNAVKYLDRLVECSWKNRPVSDELEAKLVADHKKLEKLAVRFVKNFGLHDSEIPNVMNARAFDALMYHHFSWINGERSWDQLEEVALPPLSDQVEIREKYFNYLCNKNLEDKALHLAQLMRLPEANYPARLYNFVQQCPEKSGEIRANIRKNDDMRARNEQIEAENICQLKDGTPIVLIDTLDALLKLIDELRANEQRDKLIGIDAEWRPHFLSTTERISLLQIATSKCAFLVDVLTLDEKEKLLEDNWLNFFNALLCSDIKKIGYDFRNDIRVLKSTFPFITKLFPNTRNVICLYKLLQQVTLLPDASKSLFGAQIPKQLGLSDVAKHFLREELEKNERIGNWSKRPLRLEQKKYAALDAHCLVRLYQKIAPMIQRLDTGSQLALQECALIKMAASEEKRQLCVLADGQVVRVKEGQDDFAANIQKASVDLLNGAMEPNSLIRSINDVRFVVDNMLFGLGKNLRKCGFDTRLIGSRVEIINFCKAPANADFIVLSTGKGHRELESALGGDRCLFVPISTHSGQTPPSMLVNHVMRQLKIAISPVDMWSRCVDCNKRAFVHMPVQIVKVLFYMNAVRLSASWLEITEDDLQAELARLREDSALMIRITPEIHNGEQPRQNREALDENGYYLYEDDNHTVCETRDSAVDVINKLVLAEGRGAPVSVQVGLKYKKETFAIPDIQFYVCVECGRIQFNNPSSED